MDGFNTKFIKLVEDIKEGNSLTSQLDEFIEKNSEKNIFKKAILELMDNKDNHVKIFASKYSYDYNIDKKKSFFNARYVLRKSKDICCRVEAEYIYNKHKRRHITKLTKIFKFKRKK